MEQFPKTFENVMPPAFSFFYFYFIETQKTEQVGTKMEKKERHKEKNSLTNVLMPLMNIVAFLSNIE